MIVIVIVTENDHPSAAVLFSLSESSITIRTSLGPTAACWWRRRQVPYLPCQAEASQAQRSGYGVKLETVAEISPHEAVVGENQQKNRKSPDYCWSHQLLQTLEHDPLLLLTYWKLPRHPGPRDFQPQEQNVLAPFASQA
jgi:hypothetical protein